MIQDSSHYGKSLHVLLVRGGAFDFGRKGGCNEEPKALVIDLLRKEWPVAMYHKSRCQSLGDGQAGLL